MVTEKSRVDAEKLVILASKALQSLGVPEAGAQVNGKCTGVSGPKGCGDSWYCQFCSVLY